MSDESCPRCWDVHVWRWKGRWYFDADNVVLGPEIKWCPFCGLRLPVEDEKQ